MPYFFFCINSLLHLQLKSDFLMIAEQLGSAVRTDGNIPVDLLKRARQPAWPGPSRTPSPYLQLHNQSPRLSTVWPYCSEEWEVDCVSMSRVSQLFIFLNPFVKRGSFWALAKIMTRILHSLMLALQENSYSQVILIKISPVSSTKVRFSAFFGGCVCAEGLLFSRILFGYCSQNCF